MDIIVLSTGRVLVGVLALKWDQHIRCIQAHHPSQITMFVGLDKRSDRNLCISKASRGEQPILKAFME